MNTYLKLAAGLAGAAVLAFAASQLLPTDPGPGSTSQPPPTVTTRPASPGPTAQPTDEGGPLSPGTHVVDAVAGMEITFTVPEGATGWAWGGPNFLGVPPMVDPPDGIFLGFNTVRQVTVDPCRSHIATPVGDSVADIAAFWAALPHAAIVGPTEIEVSGFQGVRFELAIDDDLTECEVEAISIYLAGPNVRVVGAGQAVELWAIDVAGTRLIVEGSSFPGSRPADVTVLERILASVELRAVD
jgi:hypothetical protein